MKDVSVCFWCWPSQAKEDPLAVLFGELGGEYKRGKVIFLFNSLE